MQKDIRVPGQSLKWTLHTLPFFLGFGFGLQPFAFKENVVHLQTQHAYMMSQGCMTWKFITVWFTFQCD